MIFLVRDTVHYVFVIVAVSFWISPACAVQTAAEKKSTVPAVVLALSRMSLLSKAKKLPTNKTSHEICSICYNDDVDQSLTYKKLRCGHEFHAACIDCWADCKAPMASVCPNCRTPISRFAIAKRHDVLRFLQIFKEDTPAVCRLICLGSYLASTATLRSVRSDKIAKALIVPTLVIMGISGGIAIVGDQPTYTSIAVKTLLVGMLAGNVGCLMEKRRF